MFVQISFYTLITTKVASSIPVLLLQYSFQEHRTESKSWRPSTSHFGTATSALCPKYFSSDTIRKYAMINTCIYIYIYIKTKHYRYKIKIHQSLKGGDIDEGTREWIINTWMSMNETQAWEDKYNEENSRQLQRPVRVHCARWKTAWFSNDSYRCHWHA
jgi:hypothetical protein